MEYRQRGSAPDPSCQPRTRQAPKETQFPWPTNFTYTICSMFWKHIKARVSGYIKLSSDQHYGEQPQLTRSSVRGHKAFVPGHALPWFYTLCTCVTVQPYTLPAISAATIEDSTTNTAERASSTRHGPRGNDSSQQYDFRIAAPTYLHSPCRVSGINVKHPTQPSLTG